VSGEVGPGPLRTTAFEVGYISVQDIFTIGIGPSSSHTVGPMRAAKRFMEAIPPHIQGTITRIGVELFGSLSLTGKGHRTDVAIVLGLLGWAPETIDPAWVEALLAQVRNSRILTSDSRSNIAFDMDRDLVFSREFHSRHPNAMTFTVYTGEAVLFSRTFFSIGGGRIVEAGDEAAPVQSQKHAAVRYPFESAAELLSIGLSSGCSIAEMMWENEKSLRTPDETTLFLDEVRDAMMACIARGCEAEGVLPGRLKVPRRARGLRDRVLQVVACPDELRALDWVCVYALAVNEENAAGGRVVTAPTNGAAGVIPAVLKYYETFAPDATRQGSRDLLLTAAAIGALYKRRASISAAEMGCQGEVGVACSMAAAGLTAALGGTNAQIENAAEIGMEHNLGLTCDPIGGLVQIPCIERNTMGALKAINASRLAMFGDGSHIVSLDAVIETMRQTGEDMRSKYKETSLGGLAVNVVEC
jgi:L-serine dehydratase